MSHTFDVIIIGSGMGGLVAAVTASNRQRRVVVLEAGKAIGGYLNPFRRGRYEFNPGLHYLGECGPGQQFTRLLELLDMSSDIQFRELSPSGFDRLVFPEYEVSMPKGHDVYHERLAADFPHERQGLAKFFRILREFGQALKVLTESRGVDSRAPGIRPNPVVFKYGRMTFEALLDSMIGDRLLKAVLGAQGGNYALPPRRASALIAMGNLDHYLGGAYFPVGGAGAIRDAFVRRIERNGGVLRRNHAVEKILVHDGRVRGVRCRNGEEFFADCVISNADAAVTYRDLIGLEHLPPRLRAQVQRTRWSLGTICLFIGTDLDLSTKGMTDANIWSFPSTDSSAYFASMFEGRLPEQDLYFLSSASVKNAGLEKTTQHHTLELVTLAPFEPFEPWADMKSMNRGPEYEALKERLADRYLACVARHVPEIRDHVRVLEVGTPATNATYAAAPRGAAYGHEHSPDQMGSSRYSIESALPGLWFCGSSTLGTGIVVAALSGFIAGDLATSTMRS